ncbi:MAG: hypothetical protein JNM06_06735 [Blastocatellia bacterium]|nr:hypothetical protein [Blastocatellia bacterium]MBN8722227.1 hypothetical protein [Acidobacteriota bacterium]
MKMCKRHIVWRGFALPIVFCFLLTAVFAQSSQQNSSSNSTSPTLFNLVASNSVINVASDEKDEKKVVTEKASSEKEPDVKKKVDSGGDSPASGGNPPPTPPGAEDPPLGFVGPKSAVRVSNPMRTDEQDSGDFIPVDDRWRVGFPEWDRHGDPTKANYPYTKGSLLNPYRQNVLKGDYPILGTDKFFTLTLGSETFLSARRIPLPSDISAQRPDSREFFGRGGLFLFNQNFFIQGDFFKGAANFKPVDWRIHAEVIFNINYAHARENVVLRIDPRRGNTRRDGIVALQQAYGEYRLGDTTKIFPFLRGKGSKGGYSPFFDTTSFRAGIQHFNSDFRGFIFNDSNLGARLFGNFASNRYQYNVAYFDMLEKDTNSGLNTLDSRAQRVLIANLYRQDTIKKGYTIQFSYHYNRDDGVNRKVDNNGFPIRPAVIGRVVPHKVRTHYFGFTSDGHFGERLPSFLWLNKIGGGLNLSTAFYQVLGEDDFNGLAGRKVDVNAQLVAVELSVDRDWKRFRTSFLYSSGDSNPTDGTARGFDHILDNNNFAGGEFSFFNQVGIPFLGTTTQLSNPHSLIPDLRSSKIQGQANHVNPGLYLYNIGADFDITQKLRVISNVNFLSFAAPQALEQALGQPFIEKSLGVDFSTGLKYRPILTENIVIFSGVSAFRPGAGFTSIFDQNCKPAGPVECGRETGNKTLFNVFATVKINY